MRCGLAAYKYNLAIEVMFDAENGATVCWRSKPEPQMRCKARGRAPYTVEHCKVFCFNCFHTRETSATGTSEFSYLTKTGIKMVGMKAKPG